ncbi:hypothetical protein [Streptomyces cadmiisoli]|uniref:hypothetical protein n=1 Tax=Streptomyces cadmiisoli TaxID=2184053 RepID=UPI003D724F66
MSSADTAYSTGDVRQTLHEAGHRLFLKPATLRPAVPGGFTLDDFTIGTTTAIVTCPAGHTVPLSDPGGQHHQRKASFGNLEHPAVGVTSGVWWWGDRPIGRAGWRGG